MLSRLVTVFLLASLAACSKNDTPTTKGDGAPKAAIPSGPPIELTFTFTDPADSGVGAGWKVYPDSLKAQARIEDGALRIDALADGSAKSPRVCRVEPVTFSRTLQASGEWKIKDVAGKKDWQGARVGFFAVNETGGFKKGKKVAKNIVRSKGTLEWQPFFRKMAPMQDVRICVELTQAVQGTVWVKSIKLSEQGAATGPKPEKMPMKPKAIEADAPAADAPAAVEPAAVEPAAAEPAAEAAPATK